MQQPASRISTDADVQPIHFRISYEKFLTKNKNGYSLYKVQNCAASFVSNC